MKTEITRWEVKSNNGISRSAEITEFLGQARNCDTKTSFFEAQRGWGWCRYEF